MNDSFQVLIDPVYSTLNSVVNTKNRATNAAIRMIRGSDYFDMGYCRDKTDLGVQSLAEKIINFALLRSSDSAKILIDATGSGVGIHEIIEIHGEDMYFQYSGLSRNSTPLLVEHFIEEFWISILLKYRRSIMSGSFFSMCVLSELFSVVTRVNPPVDMELFQKKVAISLLFLERQEGRELRQGFL